MGALADEQAFKRACSSVHSIAFAIAVLIGAGAARASEVRPPFARTASVSTSDQPYVHRGFAYRVLSAARYNSLGLSSFLRLGYQLPLLGPSDNPITQRTWLSAQAATYITPAYIRVGPRLEVQPLAILNLSVSYEFMRYFGTLRYLQSSTGLASDFSDGAQRDRQAEGEDYATSGGMLKFEPALQARVGSLAGASTTTIAFTRMCLRGADSVYYDPYYDLVTPREGWTIANETQVVFGKPTGLAVGLRSGFYHAVYPESLKQSDRARARSLSPTALLGPLLVYRFFEINGPARFNSPVVFASLSWWLRHPYRTGNETPAWLPQILVGFAFRGDL